MAKRRGKKTVKQSGSSPGSKINSGDAKEARIEKKVDGFRDQGEVQQQSAAVRAIRDVETERLLTGLRLLRSFCSEEQLQTPVLQFFEKNLPNLSFIRNDKPPWFEVQWKDGKSSLNHANGSNVHAYLLHQMSIAFPDFSSAVPSFGGFELSSKTVKTSILGANDLQIGDFVLEEPSHTQMVGLQDAFQTPGVSTQRLSVGITPKTIRLPKHGEMLLSVHGSPLGVFKEDNMEAIHESEEG